MTDIEPGGPYDMGGGVHAADRLLNAQKLSSDVYLRGEAPPTPRQVSAVLHALSDFGLTNLMLSPAVRAIGDDYLETASHELAQSHGLGRWFHRMGDWLDRDPGAAAPVVQTLHVTVSVDTDDMLDMLAWAAEDHDEIVWAKDINRRWLTRLSQVAGTDDEDAVITKMPASLVWCFFSWRADDGAEMRKLLADNPET